jgi:hypothetical protein
VLWAYRVRATRRLGLPAIQFHWARRAPSLSAPGLQSSFPPQAFFRSAIRSVVHAGHGGAKGGAGEPCLHVRIRIWLNSPENPFWVCRAGRDSSLVCCASEALQSSDLIGPISRSIDRSIGRIGVCGTSAANAAACAVFTLIPGKAAAVQLASRADEWLLMLQLVVQQ